MLFADDTSVTIYNRNLEDFCTVANLVLTRMIEWFTANKSVLNLDKKNIMKFIKKIHHTVHYVLIIQESI
jgi:hypothetical protein